MLVAIIADIAFGLGFGFPTDGGSVQSLLESSISGGAIFMAFLTATLGILLGSDSPAVDRVLGDIPGFRKQLLFCFQQAIYGALFFCLTSLGGYYLADSTAYFYLWAFVGVFTISAFMRCVRLLFLMVSKGKRKKQDNQKAYDAPSH